MIEKVQEKARADALLRSAVFGQRWWVALGSALVTVHQACEAMVLVVVGAVIDRAVATGDAGALLFWVVLLALLFVCLSASGCSAIWVNDRAALNVAHDVRMKGRRAGAGARRNPA
ncbi:MAG: hypothetical protein ACR2KW_03250 [Rubrobacter sp.]